ncbi:MAG: hypothetical protein IJ929_04120 [Prevotella sp.]|nr:hypothetical protein [Prevotella sp.]
MKKATGLTLLLLALLTLSCGNKKHDLAYYEQMVDSIRRAEQVKEIQKQANIYENPIEAWFDTLRLHTLPIQTVGADIEILGNFVAVPVPANEYFGYPADAHLKAMALPSMYRKQVILLCEMQDSITPALYLYTMNKKHQPIDMLNIYHQETNEDHGMTYNEYFITSHYEITIMRYFKGHEAVKPQIEEARRYTISKDGMFEEQPIEL